MIKLKKSSHQAIFDQYREVFEEIEDIILILDQDGMIEYVNRALRKHLGFEKRSYTGKNVTDCLLFDENIPDAEFIKRLYRQRDFMTHVKNAEGETLHFSWKTKIFSDNGEKKLLAILRDMTLQIRLQRKAEEYSKNLQDMVYQRTQQLEKEKQKAIELHQAKAIFLSKMSHELRTPLTAICGYSELLDEKGVSSADRKKYLHVIQKNAQGLLEMINETLDMVQLEQNKYQISERSFSLHSLIKDLQETFEVLAEEKQLKLKCSIAEGIPDKMYSDPIAIRQILTNLVGNAIKFTSHGGVALKVKQRTFPHRMTQKIYFYVEDTGIGIPQEHHRRVFRSFEQYLDNQYVHARGSGLGLAIGKQMAKLLGGNIKLLSSQPNSGSTFVFSFPVRTSPPSRRGHSS